MTQNCFEQLTDRARLVELYVQICALGAEVETVVGQVAATEDFSIPVGAKSWSVFVTGSNATIDGVAVVTLTHLSGTGPLDTAIALEAGASTTIGYTYTT